MLVVAGCGSQSSTDAPLIKPAPTVVGTVSAQVAKATIFKDVMQARRLMDSSDASTAVQDLYTLLNKAAAVKDVERGAAMLRIGVPRIVGRFEASYPATLAGLRALHFQTQAGEQIRSVDISVLNQWHQVLPRFATDIVRSRLAWGAVTRFGTQNNRMNKQTGDKLVRLIQSLPADQRQTLEKAITQTYGK